MPPREWRLRVQDIIEAVEKIGRYTDGLSAELFRADERTVEAVLWNFTIIGEAARHIPPTVEARFSNIP